MGRTDSMQYVHYVPKVKLDSEWHTRCLFNLVTSIEELKDIFKDFVDGKTCISFDLESNGLDAEEHFIVGVCLSMDGVTGHYIPINHYDNKYNLGDEGLDIIYDYLCRCARCFVFNMRFDFRLMEYHGFDKKNPEHVNSREIIGYDMSKVKYYDVAVGIFLSDSNVKYPSLKWACFTGDTGVKTDKGVVPISEIIAGHHKAMLGDTEHNILTQKSMGVKDVYELEFEDGSIVKCTDDHRFLVKDAPCRWVMAKDLDESCEIVTESDFNNLYDVEKQIVLRWMQLNY